MPSQGGNEGDSGRAAAGPGGMGWVRGLGARTTSGRCGWCCEPGQARVADRRMRVSRRLAAVARGATSRGGAGPDSSGGAAADRGATRCSAAPRPGGPMGVASMVRSGRRLRLRRGCTHAGALPPPRPAGPPLRSPSLGTGGGEAGVAAIRHERRLRRAAKLTSSVLWADTEGLLRAWTSQAIWS